MAGAARGRAGIAVTVDVLVPTFERPAALAVTLTALLGQRDVPPLRVVVADQSRDPVTDDALVASVLRVLAHHGTDVEVLHRPRRRGVAENRQALLAAARAPELLFLDDDVVLEPGALARMRAALHTLGVGMVAASAAGLSYKDDERPHDWAPYEQVTEGPVPPERVRRGTAGWERWRLHNAANVVHLAGRHPPPAGRAWTAYRVAWSAGCWLARKEAVEAVGGWTFWQDLPSNQRGEDLVVQLRVQEEYGAVGVLPSGSYHLELPTTLHDREADAYALVLDAAPEPVAAQTLGGRRSSG